MADHDPGQNAEIGRKRGKFVVRGAMVSSLPFVLVEGRRREGGYIGKHEP
jgi:hypothetical protein